MLKEVYALICGSHVLRITGCRTECEHLGAVQVNKPEEVEEAA